MTYNGIKANAGKEISTPEQKSYPLSYTLADVIKKYQSSVKSDWIEIKEPQVADLIINTYGDNLKRKILSSVTLSPLTMMDILHYCQLPQTTGYRKILKLIDDYFIVPCDTIQKNGRKKTNLYISTIDSLTVEVKGNTEVSVRIRVSDLSNMQK